MEVRNLKAQTYVKNYKEMCKLLAEPEKGGKSKALQLKEWSRFFLFEKQGHQFYISEIYSFPLEKKDKRKAGNHPIYLKFVEAILTSSLSTLSTRTFSKQELLELLGLVNPDYRRISSEKLKQIISGISDDDIKDFYKRSNAKLTYILSTALDNMASRSILEYSYKTIVSTTEHRVFIAGSEELRVLSQFEHVVLKEMGLNCITQAYLSGCSDEFYTRLTEKLRDSYNWSYWYKKYYITLLTQAVPLSFDELTQFRLGLNAKVIQALNSNAKTVHNNQMKRKSEDFTTEFTSLARTCVCDLYINYQEELSKRLIKI